MPSYFCKTIKDKTWKPLAKKAILIASQTYKLHSTLFCFHWISVRKSAEWSLSEFKK